MGAISEKQYEGGCHCRSVRYRVSGTADGPAVCYCEDCRETVGAQSVAWVSFPSGSLIITAGNPVAYRSSEHVERLFCGQCGTSLIYRNSTHPDHIDITIASLDDAASVAPNRLVYTSRKLPWDRPLELPTVWDVDRETED